MGSCCDRLDHVVCLEKHGTLCCLNIEFSFFLSFGSFSNFLCCSVICLRKLFYLLPQIVVYTCPTFSGSAGFLYGTSIFTPPFQNMCLGKAQKELEKSIFLHLVVYTCDLETSELPVMISLCKNSLSVPQQPKNEACGMKSICKRMGTLIASVSGRFPVLEGRVEERMILGYGLIYTSIRLHLLHGLPQPVLF